MICIVSVYLSLIAQIPPEVVEPSELARRTELVGASVSVDDRVRLFLPHPGRGVDEILFKRTPVVFRLPPSLRWTRAPEATSAKVDGILRRDGETLYVEVTAVTLLEDDLKRLDRGVAALGPNDAENRAAWARWAERRGSEFGDQSLRKRAVELDAQALRIDAARPDADPAARWLRLARRARALNREAEAAFLAHRAFRSRLATIAAEALEPLADEVAGFFPEAPKPSGVDLSGVRARYDADPTATYEAAAPALRAGLDHRLWADVVQRSIERRAAADPARSLALAEDARRRLPDRPELATRLEATGIEVQSRDAANLGRGDLEALARRHEAAGRPARAREARRTWLDAQRASHLADGDADGRISLASLYRSMLDDAATADALLREAGALAPESKALADTYRKLGYRRSEGGWVLPNPQAPPDAADRPTAAGLLNSTPRQVRDRLGKPDRVGRSATQGRIMLQWTYVGTKGTQVINFAQSPGNPEPIVVRHYSVP